MKWERPDFVEIGMNAEIGSYQEDFDDREPNGLVFPAVSAESNETATSAS